MELSKMISVLTILIIFSLGIAQGLNLSDEAWFHYRESLAKVFTSDANKEVFTLLPTPTSPEGIFQMLQYSFENEGGSVSWSDQDACSRYENLLINKDQLDLFMAFKRKSLREQNCEWTPIDEVAASGTEFVIKGSSLMDSKSEVVHQRNSFITSDGFREVETDALNPHGFDDCEQYLDESIPQKKFPWQKLKKYGSIQPERKSFEYYLRSFMHEVIPNVFHTVKKEKEAEEKRIKKEEKAEKKRLKQEKKEAEKAKSPEQKAAEKAAKKEEKKRKAKKKKLEKQEKKQKKQEKQKAEKEKKEKEKREKQQKAETEKAEKEKKEKQRKEELQKASSPQEKNAIQERIKEEQKEEAEEKKKQQQAAAEQKKKEKAEKKAKQKEEKEKKADKKRKEKEEKKAEEQEYILSVNEVVKTSPSLPINPLTPLVLKKTPFYQCVLERVENIFAKAKSFSLKEFELKFTFDKLKVVNIENAAFDTFGLKQVNYGLVPKKLIVCDQPSVVVSLSTEDFGSMVGNFAKHRALVLGGMKFDRLSVVSSDDDEIFGNPMHKYQRGCSESCLQDFEESDPSDPVRNDFELKRCACICVDTFEAKGKDNQHGFFQKQFGKKRLVKIGKDLESARQKCESSSHSIRLKLESSQSQVIGIISQKF